MGQPPCQLRYYSGSHLPASLVETLPTNFRAMQHVLFVQVTPVPEATPMIQKPEDLKHSSIHTCFLTFICPIFVLLMYVTEFCE